MKKDSTLKRHEGLQKDLNICEKSDGSSDLELTGGPALQDGIKVNGQSVVMGVGKSDMFDFIKGLD